MFSYFPVCFFLYNGSSLKAASNHFFLNKSLFIYFWLHWVFVAARELSLIAARWGYSSLQCVGFSLQ